MLLRTTPSSSRSVMQMGDSHMLASCIARRPCLCGNDPVRCASIRYGVCSASPRYDHTVTRHLTPLTAFHTVFPSFLMAWHNTCTSPNAMAYIRNGNMLMSNTQHLQHTSYKGEAIMKRFVICIGRCSQRLIRFDRVPERRRSAYRSRMLKAPTKPCSCRCQRIPVLGKDR